MKICYKFGVDEEMFEEMKAEQNNCCANCLDPESTPGKDRWHGTSELHIDHCHKTDTFRGFLCDGCNTALGKFKDDSAVVQHALTYLQSHQWCRQSQHDVENSSQ